MQSTTLLITKIKTDYPQFSFKKAPRFLWSPSEKTIYYTNKNDDDYIYLLHELSHGLLGHADYDYDVKLLTMERQAWDMAVKIAQKYDLSIDDDIIQNNLDSYRDWLHNRSKCPDCSSNGVQIDKNCYKCPVCNSKWRVNESRICALRRYKI